MWAKPSTAFRTSALGIALGCAIYCEGNRTHGALTKRVGRILGPKLLALSIDHAASYRVR